MELLEAVQKRHSVRMYQDREIPDSIKKELLDFINQCNQTSGLNIQLILDEPKAFDNFMAHYGKFSGVKNYLALIGKKSVKLEEMCGYGIDNGATHKIKTIEQVSEVTGDMPSWFETGVKTALLAPTAMNQQKFKFILNDNTVKVKPGLGFYTKLDLGIVKYHFEIGAGTNNFIWQ